MKMREERIFIHYADDYIIYVHQVIFMIVFVNICFIHVYSKE